MSTAELELKTQTFAADLTNEELSQVDEILDDLRLVRECEEISERIERGEEETVPWEVIRARLDKRFGITD